MIAEHEDTLSTPFANKLASSLPGFITRLHEYRDLHVCAGSPIDHDEAPRAMLLALKCMTQLERRTALGIAASEPQRLDPGALPFAVRLLDSLLNDAGWLSAVLLEASWQGTEGRQLVQEACSVVGFLKSREFGAAWTDRANHGKGSGLQRIGVLLASALETEKAQDALIEHAVWVAGLPSKQRPPVEEAPMSVLSVGLMGTPDMHQLAQSRHLMSAIRAELQQWQVPGSSAEEALLLLLMWPTRVLQGHAKELAPLLCRVAAEG